jgi:hypothetical protein
MQFKPAKDIEANRSSQVFPILKPGPVRTAFAGTLRRVTTNY